MKSVPSHMAVRLASVAAVCALGGCAVGPDFHKPAPPATAGYTASPLPDQTASADVAAGEAQRFAVGGDIPAQWWELFGSRELNELIARSLKANPDLEAARAALRAAHEATLAQVGGYYPSVQANASASRNKTARTLSPATASGAEYYTLYTGQVTASFVPDVFGLTRRTVESTRAQEESQRFQTEATYLTLTSNVVAAAVQEASLRAQVAATVEIVRVETEQLDLMRRQQDLGAIAVADVLGQEAALAQAQQALPPLQKQLDQQRDLLAALAGGVPSEPPSETFELEALHLPQEIPVSLPVRLVEHRPDIRAAEANLHAACAQVGVAIANRLPNINITANPGSVALASQGMAASWTGFWSVGAGITQPIFEGGTLLHKERAARALLDQAGAQYRSTVNTALQNVADALHALQADADAVKAGTVAERATASSLAIARKQFELGSVAYLTLLVSEQACQQARISLVQAQAARLADTAALFQALGGGWWNRSGAAAP